MPSVRAAFSAPNARRVVSPRLSLAVLIAVAVLTSMDLPMVGVALPFLPVSDRPFGLFDIIWTLVAVSLPFSVLLTTEVLRAEARGRRRLVLRGLFGYAVGAGLAAIGPTLATVVLARALQGTCVIAVGGALAICADAPDRAARTRRIALWGAGTALGFGLGPFAGALMLSLGSWRFIFVLQAVLAVVLLLLARATLVESRAVERPAIPRVGVRMVGITAFAVVFWGVDGALQGGVDMVDAGFMVGGLAIGALWLWMLRRRPETAKAPATTSSAFRANRVTTMIGLALGAGIGASTLADAFYLSSILGLGPLGVGLGVLPVLAGALPVGLIVRLFGAQRGHRAMLVVGGTTWVTGLLMVIASVTASETGTGQYLTVLIGLIMQGAGVGLVITALGQLAVNRSPRREWLAAEVGSGLAARSMGATIGFFALVALANGKLPSDPIVPLRAWAFAAVAGLVVIGLVIAVGRELRLPEQSAADPVMDLSRMARATMPVVESGPAIARELDPFRDLPLFAGLTDEQIQTLRAASQPLLLSAGDDLFRVGDPARSLYIVRSGRLVTRVGDAVAATHTRGELIGEADVLRGDGHTGTVVAVRDSSLLAIPADTFTSTADAGVYRRLAARLADRIAVLEPQVLLEREAAGRDAVVAVIGLDPGLPVDDVRDAIAGRIARWRSVVMPGVVDRLGLEHAEEDAQHVVLAAGDEDRRWREFCVRSADRLVLLTRRPVPPTSVEQAWLGADVLVLDAVPTNAEWTAWENAVRPGFSRATTMPLLADDVMPIADRVAGRSIGLALGGGGAKGLAHLGVIEVLTEAGLRFDRVAGTSMGAIVGSLYAAGLDPEQMDALAYELLVRNHPMSDFTVPRNSILRGRRIDVALHELFGDLVIEALPRTFRCVSVDLVSRAAVVHRSGPVADAVAASSRLPGILPVYPHPGGGLHVDGAMLNNLPVSVLTGAEGPVIAVEVGGRNELAKRVAQGETTEQLSLAETIFRSLMMASDDANEDAIRSAAVHIRPDTHGATITEFHRLDILREAGRTAALAALPDIAALLGRRN